MHYKNGREAHECDPVITIPSHDGQPFRSGTLAQLATNPECTTCNAILVQAKVGGIKEESVNIKDCLHAQDAWELANGQPESWKSVEGGAKE